MIKFTAHCVSTYTHRFTFSSWILAHPHTTNHFPLLACMNCSKGFRCNNFYTFIKCTLIELPPLLFLIPLPALMGFATLFSYKLMKYVGHIHPPSPPPFTVPALAGFHSQIVPLFYTLIIFQV
jgi:hypothetical protein